VKAILTWLKVSFVAFLDGLQRISQNSSSPLSESLMPEPTAPEKPAPKKKKPTGARADFQKLLDEAGVRHFTADEVFFRGARDAKLNLNTDPPRSLWPSLLAVTKVADEARHRLGRPLRINSGYRSPAYNRAISGSSASIHMRGGALDLSGSPATLHRILQEMRAEGLFRGGIGRYKTFTHVDVRGKNADWQG
jgi:hypothetical protein